MATHVNTAIDRLADNANINANNNEPSSNEHLSMSQTDDAKFGSLTTDVATTREPLHIHVERAVRAYFVAMGDEMPTDLYELILAQVELPLLTVVVEKTRGNQTKCAQILGLNRGTLRKKLKTYHLMT